MDPGDCGSDAIGRSAELVGDGCAKYGDRPDGHGDRPVSTQKRWLFWADRLAVSPKDPGWRSSLSWRG